MSDSNNTSWQDKIANTKNDDKDDYEPKFIKKDEPVQENEANEVECQESKDASQEIIEDLKSEIFFPPSNQQRNLDRETGGLEEDKSQGSYTSEDVWDDRSEVVDEMGTVDTFNSTAGKSFVWRKKKEKLDSKKMAKEIAQDSLTASEVAHKTKKMSHVEKVKLRQLKQDRSHEGNSGQGGNFLG